MARLRFIIFFCLTAGRSLVGSPISGLPRVGSIPQEDVIFELYTSKNTAGTRVTIGDTSALETGKFNAALPTKILVHGWMDDLQSGFVTINKQEFLAVQEMNVFGVGWDKCARNVLYEQAVECSKQVGEYIGDLILWLAEATGLSPANVHVIGHSLGGQAISFISRRVKVGRISALDPAAPLFTHEIAENKIDVGDADFVDTFHTSIKLIGVKAPVGHIDFYPNGGSEQPGCGGLFGSCSHGAAYAYYAHTIPERGRNDYLAYQCTSLEEARNGTCVGEPRAVMGYGASPLTPGIYYLNITTVPWSNFKDKL